VCVCVCVRARALTSSSSGETKAGVKTTGTIDVPNLSDENDMEDLDVSLLDLHL